MKMKNRIIKMKKALGLGLMIGVLMITSLGTVSAQTVEDQFWDAVKNSKRVEDYDSYLKNYPTGKYAPLAKLKKSQLNRNNTSNPVPKPVNEDVLWGQVNKTNTIQSYQNYLNTFPNGKYKPLANLKINQLKRVVNPGPKPTPKISINTVTINNPTPKNISNARMAEALKFKGDRTGVNSIAFSPDGKRIAGGGWGNMVRVWETGTGKELLAINLTGKGDLVLDVSFSPNGQLLASSSRDYETRKETIKIWNAFTGTEAVTLQTPPPDICSSVTFNSAGTRVALGCWDGKMGVGTLKIWDPRTGAEIRTIKNFSGPVAFSPDGTQLAAVGSQSLKFLDAQTGRELRNISGSAFKGFRSIAYSRDGKRLVSGNWDGTIKVWDTRTGSELLTIKGHTDRVNGVAFDQAGKWIVSGSQDGWVRFWNSGTGRQMDSLKSTKPVSTVAFSPEGRQFAAGGQDGMVRIFDVFEMPILTPPTQNN